MVRIERRLHLRHRSGGARPSRHATSIGIGQSPTSGPGARMITLSAIRRFTAVTVLLAITVLLLTLSRGTYARGEADGTSVIVGHETEAAVIEAD